MKQLPKYIILYILETIFNYKYNTSQLIESFNYHNNESTLIIYNNETIKYSLVCKEWFRSCRIILSNLTTNNNHLILYQFIKDNSSNNNDNDNDNDNDNSFKLIINKSFQKINFDEIKYNNNNINGTRCDSSSSGNKNNSYNEDKYSVIIKVDNLDLDNFQIQEMKKKNQEIKGINQMNEIELVKYPSNYEFQVTIGDQFRLFSTTFSNSFNNNLSLYLYGISVPLADLMKLKPKSVEYRPNDFNLDAYIHRSYECLFKCDSIEHLYISNSEHVNPNDISYLKNNTTKLRSLSITMLFHPIIIALNQVKKGSNKSSIKHLQSTCNNKHRGIKIINSVQEDWDNMIDTLKSNTTIKELYLNNLKCQEGLKCIRGQDTSVIGQSFSEIFTSGLSSIETLKLENFEFLDSEFLSGLFQSKSIKNLSIVLDDSIYEFNFRMKVIDIFEYLAISDNNTLRNLEVKLNSLTIQDLDRIINICDNQINLYSLSIYFEDIEEIPRLMNNIKKRNFQINITEIIFYNNNQFYNFINNNNNNNNSNHNYNNSNNNKQINKSNSNDHYNSSHKNKKIKY